MLGLGVRVRADLGAGTPRSTVLLKSCTEWGVMLVIVPAPISAASSNVYALVRVRVRLG